MEIQAKILNGRVYFGTFDKGNDIDPKTKRSGLNFFRFNLIGWLLHKLGFAPHKVHYTDGEKHGVVYLHPKSFEPWIERHKSDNNLNQKDLNKALSQKDFEKAIQIIYENFTNHRKVNDQDKITPNPPYDNQKNIQLQKPPEKVQEEVNGAGKPIEVIKQAPVLPQEKSPQIPAIAFGKKEWAELGLEVEDIPLPKDIDAILKSPCPFSKNGETVDQTHVFVLKPGSINGEDFNAENFGKFMKSKFPELDKEGYLYISENTKKLGSNEKARWILMKKDVIDGSRSKSFAEQQKKIEEHGQGKYQVPGVVDVIVCAMAEYARSKTRLFSNDPLTYTRCQENISGFQMVVGGFAPAGLDVFHNNYGLGTIGVAALRKF